MYTCKLQSGGGGGGGTCPIASDAYASVYKLEAGNHVLDIRVNFGQVWWAVASEKGNDLKTAFYQCNHRGNDN